MISRFNFLPVIAVGALLAACGGADAPSPSPSVAASKPAASAVASVAASKPATSAAASAPAAAASAKPAASGGPASGAPAPSGVTITVNQPKDGSSVPAGDVTVSYDVTGVTLVAGSQATKPDDYHVHVLLDVDPMPYLRDFQQFPGGTVPGCAKTGASGACAQLIGQANPNILHTADKSVTFKNVAAGSHKINVSLATSNHITVSPVIQANVTFTTT
jgi:hypothetical protein